MSLRIDELQVGDWWAPCCCHDLEQIVTAEDLASVTEYPYAGGWRTLQEAIDDLLRPGVYVLVSPDEYQEELDYAYQKFGLRPTPSSA